MDNNPSFQTVPQSDARRYPSPAEQSAAPAPTRDRRRRFGRLNPNHRVVLRPLSPRTLNELRDLVEEAVAARRAVGKADSRATHWVLSTLRTPRAGFGGELQGRRVLQLGTGDGALLVRQLAPDGRVVLQELEGAGAGVRPVPGAFWQLFSGEIEAVGRALLQLAGLSFDASMGTRADAKLPPMRCTLRLESSEHLASVRLALGMRVDDLSREAQRLFDMGCTREAVTLEREARAIREELLPQVEWTGGTPNVVA